MKTKRNIGTLKGLAAIAVVSLPLVFGSGCTSMLYKDQTAVGGAVRTIVDHTPFLWNDEVKETQREYRESKNQSENVRGEYVQDEQKLPENVYRTVDGELWPKSGYKWKNDEEGNYEVVPIK